MWLNVNAFVLLFEYLHDLFNDLISNVVNMGASFNGTDRVHERDLLELTVTQGAHNLPSIICLLDNLRKLFVFLCLKVEVDVGIEVLYINQLPVKFNLDRGRSAASHVINTLSHQGHYVLVKVVHPESLEVRLKGNASEVFALWIGLDLRLLSHTHIISPPLSVCKLVL